MIKNKKFIAVISVLAMIVTIFSGLTAYAAVPAANLTIIYNEAESTSTKLVYDVSTDADYLVSASIIWDISEIWSSVSGGTTLSKKAAAIAEASNMSDAILANTDATSAKVTAIKNKIKIQLATSTMYPFDLTESDEIAKVVIPLDTALSSDMTFNVVAADTFLTPGIESDETDSGYETAEQYLDVGAMTINSTTLIAKANPNAPQGPVYPSDDSQPYDKDNDGTYDYKYWSFTNQNVADYFNNVKTITLTNNEEGVADPIMTQRIFLPFNPGTGTFDFNVYAKISDVYQNVTCTIN